MQNVKVVAAFGVVDDVVDVMFVGISDVEYSNDVEVESVVAAVED